jgi:23S rRNA pseudouridine1911/1915/1917 synthase
MLGIRIDKVLSNIIDKSRETISEDIKDGHVLVNGKVVKPSYKLEENDEISYTIDDPKPLELEKEDLGLDIVYEDSDVAVVNKPSGMVVHHANGNLDHTLVNGLLYQMDLNSSINGVVRPGIVHRIDKDTSGLICVAKNDKAHLSLAEQLKDHTMARTYVALVKGVIPENTGEINLPIGRDPHNRQKMAVTRSNSKEAITYFKVLQRFSDHTLVECHLKTGRTHQIRVHLSYIGYPVVGDPLYSGRKYDTLYKNGQLLVAVGLKLIHPSSNKEMEFKIDLPDYFKEVISHLE